MERFWLGTCGTCNRKIRLPESSKEIRINLRDEKYTVCCEKVYVPLKEEKHTVNDQTSTTKETE